ncbi:hypothetical protein EYF80_024881 [Liparis tanakae]|uniref:Uncharacterized protein n=1 Tax=Liparis tanakae TaxID=230148 RepID=A0A4Z2HIW9_9TELE|nr:hypothetical protein EYF80_024881 [Liparis tanakae]
MYSRERAVTLMFPIHMRGVDPLLKKGRMNGDDIVFLHIDIYDVVGQADVTTAATKTLQIV